MPSDKFKKLAPTFQIFKDGEQVRVKKLGKIIDKTQEAFENLELAIGDIYNYQIAIQDNPLFQNSIGRSIGPVDELAIQPAKRFEILQKLKTSLHQGLIRWPFASNSASDAGNKALNLLPVINQTDKIGIGCTQDNGTKCLAGYTDIYKQEKRLNPNHLFEYKLDDWDYVGVIYNDGAYFNASTASIRYNALLYSQDFTNWTSDSRYVLTSNADDDPAGGTNATKFTLANPIQSSAKIYTTTDTSVSGIDWTFSLWVKSDTTDYLHLSINGATIIDGKTGSEITKDNYLTIPVSSGFSRQYVHARFPSYVSGIQPEIYTSLGEYKPAHSFYVWGAQVEPTRSPTEYQYTNGTIASSGAIGLELSKTLTTIPGHVYQANVNMSFISGTGTMRLYISGASESYTSLVSGENYVQYTADSSRTKFYITPYIGTSLWTQATISEFRIDPGTPCHAMNCPGFSAYEKQRRYRAVIPTVTVQGHQYFGQKLTLPDDFRLSFDKDLPANILGIFDHEVNHMVPESLVSWNLANWSINSDSSYYLVFDNEFNTNWTSGSPGEYPSEFSPISTGTGSLVRDTIISTAFLETITPASYDDLLIWVNNETLPGTNDLDPLPNDVWPCLDSAARLQVASGIDYRRNNQINGYPAVQCDEAYAFDERQMWRPRISMATTDGLTYFCMWRDEGALGANARLIPLTWVKSWVNPEYKAYGIHYVRTGSGDVNTFYHTYGAAGSDYAAITTSTVPDLYDSWHLIMIRFEPAISVGPNWYHPVTFQVDGVDHTNTGYVINNDEFAVGIDGMGYLYSPIDGTDRHNDQNRFTDLVIYHQALTDDQIALLTQWYSDKYDLGL